MERIYKMTLELRKCCKGNDYWGEDCISKLPDDILLLILSRLTLREAGRTSVLSKRWERLWRYITNLNFDVSDTTNSYWQNLFTSDITGDFYIPSWNFYDFWLTTPSEQALPAYQVEHDTAGHMFVSWVNQALKLHRGSFVDEFRVCGPLHSTFSRDIDSWIEFAIKKRVKRLELDFSYEDEYNLNAHYRFPDVERISTILSLGNVSTGFYFLTDLCLKYVNVTQEVIDYLLCTCLLLERVHVRESGRLVNLKVVGPSLNLKYLKISHCSRIQQIDISAPNLVSFKYCGQTIVVNFNNVPLLSDVSFGGEYCTSLIKQFHQHPNYFYGLRALRLDPTLQVLCNNLGFPLKFPELSNLEQLELKIYASDAHSLLWSASLIKAAPFLKIFRLKDTDEQYPEMVKEATKCVHKSLKVVELVGFIGNRHNIELALHLLEIAVSLEKIIIDCRVLPEKKAKARASARMHLETKIRPGMELVIL